MADSGPQKFTKLHFWVVFRSEQTVSFLCSHFFRSLRSYSRIKKKLRHHPLRYQMCCRDWQNWPTVNYQTDTMQQLTNLFLLAHLLSLSAGLRVIANGLGLPVYGAEENVVDYAQLAVDKKAALPSQVRPGNMLVLIFFLFSSPSARLQHLMLCSPPSYSFNFSGSRGILGFHSLCWVGKTTYSNYR